MTADEQYNSNVRNFFCSSDSSTGKPRPPLLLFLLLQKLQLYTAVVVSLVTSCLWPQLPAPSIALATISLLTSHLCCSWLCHRL